MKEIQYQDWVITLFTSLLPAFISKVEIIFSENSQQAAIQHTYSLLLIIVLLVTTGTNFAYRVKKQLNIWSHLYPVSYDRYHLQRAQWCLQSLRQENE